MMRVDRGIDQIAPQAPKPRQGPIFVRAGKPAVADDVRYQDRRDLPSSRHGAPSYAMQNSTKINQSRAPIDREGLSQTEAELAGHLQNRLRVAGGHWSKQARNKERQISIHQTDL
jgi:hypothetical protein